MNASRTTCFRARSSRLQRAGIFQIDALMGLIILIVLGTAFTVAVSRQRAATSRMADLRGATWAAEHALAQLQSGRPADEAIRVEPLQSDNIPAGYAWVRVHATLNGRAASLIGLVPRDAVPATGPTTAPAKGGGQ